MVSTVLPQTSRWLTTSSTPEVSMVEHQAGDAFVKIVYAKVQSNGRTEMVPLKLYVDGSLEHITASLFPSSESGVSDQTLLGNRYLVQRVLGQGGFGRTYLAVDRHRFDELCVVKEFLPQNTEDIDHQKSRDLFEREAKILHEIDHPQIPKFLACFEDMGRLFLVQDYVNGRTYSSLLRERQRHNTAFSEAEVLDWLKNLLPVLDYIHNCNIIHRDISPDNIMLHQDQNVPMLIDFGVGKWTMEQLQLSDAAPFHAPKHSIVGKIGYAPHEQLWMGRCFPNSDLYALAVTAIVLLTGKEPKNLVDSRTLSWQWQKFVQVSDRLAQVLNRMLSDKPSERYSTAKEVVAALEGTDTTIVSHAPVIPTVSQSTTVPQRTISSVLIEQCERELMNYIGPIAQFLVQDILRSAASPEAFIAALAERIPNPQQANDFQRKLLRQ
jgi:serine/threonine protein kinase